MMSFDEFAKKVVEEIKNYLPEWYENATVEVTDFQKLNDSYTGLKISLPDSNVTPCFNLEAAYENYCDGADLNMLLEKMADAFVIPNPQIDMKSFLDYESIKDKLFVRVSNAEKNKDVLAEFPHTMMDDLAITYHILVQKDNEGIASTPVNMVLLETYGISVEQLHEDAMNNAPQIMPVMMESVGKVIEKEMRREMEKCGASEQEIEMMLSECQMDGGLIVVTNDVKSNGASAIFYPDMMDECAEKFGGDFYIIPSSTDEVLILPDNGEMSISEINAMIQEVNVTQVNENMRLGDEAYHYDASEQIFEKASAYEDRMTNKQADKDVLAEKGSVLKKMDEKKKEAATVAKENVTVGKKTREESL